MTTDRAAAIARCEAELAAIRACPEPWDRGKLLGELDWMEERKLLEEEG